MDKIYPILQIPPTATCIRGENEPGVFEWRADSQIFFDENTNTLYKHYQVQQPENIALYHTIQNNLARWKPINRRKNGTETIIGNKPIEAITAQFFPLKQEDVYSDGIRGTIATPTYIPWPTLMDEIIERPQATRLIHTICAQISGDVWRMLKLPHINHYPDVNPANIKYKIHDKRLYLLITDVWWPEFGVYEMIRNFQYPRDQEKLNFQEIVTPQTQQIIDLFLQKE